MVQTGVATIRRSNTVNAPRPAPPVRRNSSITGLCSAAAGNRRAHGSIPENVVVTATMPQHRRTMSDVSCHFNIDDDHDDCDDLPLPPPPAELMADLMCNNVDDTVVSRPPIGRVSVAHANVINCLNLKFTTAKKQPDSRNNDMSPTLSSSNDVTPTGNAPQGALLSQIQNGVKLRRASTNDRSNPKL